MIDAARTLEILRHGEEHARRRAVADLRSKGMTIVENVDKAKFQATLAPTFVEFGKKFGQDNIDKIKNYK